MSCISLKIGLHTVKRSICPFFPVYKDISYPCLISFFLTERPRPRSERSGAPYLKKIETYRSKKKKEVQSKADHNSAYCFFLTVFRLAIPSLFSKPENMQDRRPRFLQLISFSNLSMPENLVMMSASSVHPYKTLSYG